MNMLKRPRLNAVGATHIVAPVVALLLIGVIGTYVAAKSSSHADAALPNLVCSASYSPSGDTISTDGNITVKETFTNTGGGSTTAKYYTYDAVYLTKFIGTFGKDHFYQLQLSRFLGSSGYYTLHPTGATTASGSFSKLPYPYASFGLTRTPNFVPPLTHGATASYTSQKTVEKATNSGSANGFTIEPRYVHVNASGSHVYSSYNCGPAKTYRF